MTRHLSLLEALSGAWLALDFETASRARDSACAVGWVEYEGSRLLARHHHLIHTTERFIFTDLHGLSAEDVATAQPFPDLWREHLAEPLSHADCIVAHNASFDRAVLLACCGRHALRPPNTPFLCTRALSSLLGFQAQALSGLAVELGFEHTPHHPLSDAWVAAQLALLAFKSLT